MLDIIKSYFKDESFYLIITDKVILIKNYKKIIELTSDLALINVSNKYIKLKGNNLSLKKSIGSDLSIDGNIESVEINDYN